MFIIRTIRRLNFQHKPLTELAFNRTGILRESPYCVILSATDLTVDQSTITAPNAASANVCIVTDLSKMHASDRPAAQALQSGVETVARKKNRKNRKLVDSSEEASTSDESNQSKSKMSSLGNLKVLYPHEVTVSRKSKILSRVVQPVNVKDLLTDVPLVFRIVEDRTAAFGVTANAGIVYVRNVSALQEAPEMLYQ